MYSKNMYDCVGGDVMIYTNNNQLLIELKKCFMENGLTHKEIAEKLGCSPQMFSQILRKKHLSFADVSKILKIAGMSLDIKFVKS